MDKTDLLKKKLEELAEVVQGIEETLGRASNIPDILHGRRCDECGELYNTAFATPNCRCSSDTWVML